MRTWFTFGLTGLLTVQALSDFLLVTLTVQLRQSSQHFDARRLRDGEADSVVLRQVRNLVKTMFEIKIIPAIGARYGGVHFALQ
ncbi:MAG: hypothetical protein CL549_09585 [Alcanivorax sp.]|nr:hypothetical protein [Alcanivorax sp.]MAY10727.1 hypothetical protein [Alcanivorax sp.]MBI56445.1 hypothetical protein [Alcanivorax sp.]